MKQDKIASLLNEARKAELTAITQYLQHHYLAKGINSPTVGEIFKKLSMDEMKHAYEIAERIVALGGVPTTQRDPAKVPTGLAGMIRQNLNDEYKAISDYKRYVKEIGDEDSTTRRMLEDILADEEGHAKELEALLGK